MLNDIPTSWHIFHFSIKWFKKKAFFKTLYNITYFFLVNELLFVVHELKSHFEVLLIRDYMLDLQKGGHSRIWEDDNKMYLKQIVCEGVDWI